MRLKPYLLVRWIVEGLSGSAEKAVVFAESAEEAKWVATQEIERSTTSNDWDAREVRLPRARRTALALSRGC